jgi:Tfp pilus assembly protein PilO
MKSLSRQKIAAISLALLAVVIGVAGYLLVIKPQSAKTRALDAQIAQARVQYVALHGGSHGKPELHAAELFQLSRAMPEQDDQPGIVLELARLAANSGVDLLAIVPQPRVALADGSSAVPVTVTISGGWPKIATFMRLVRYEVSVKGTSFSVGGRLFDIDSIQVTPPTSSSSSTGIQVIIQMSAFDYGAPPSPTATAGAAGGTTTTTTTTTKTSTTPTSSGSQQAAGATGSSS